MLNNAAKTATSITRLNSSREFLTATGHFASFSFWKPIRHARFITFHVFSRFLPLTHRQQIAFLVGMIGALSPEKAPAVGAS